MTYIRMTEDVYNPKEGTSLKKGQLGALIKETDEGAKLIYFLRLGVIEVSEESFKILKDEDKLKVVLVEHETNYNYTLTEDQFNTDIETILNILEDVKEFDLKNPDQNKYKITLTFSEKTLKEINAMPEM